MTKKPSESPAAVESLSVGLLIIDPEGRISWCSQVAADFLGMEQSELLEADLLHLARRPSGKPLSQRFRQLLPRLRQQSPPAPLALRLRTEPDQADRWLELAAETIPEGPLARSWVVTVEEVTALRQAALAQEQTQDQEARIEQLSAELRSLKEIVLPPAASVTARLFDLKPLRDYAPTDFGDLVRSYGELMEQAVQKRIYKTDFPISDHLRTMAEKLGFLKAGPRDIIDLHSAALESKSEENATPKLRGFVEVGHHLILELMGYLVSFYRNTSSGVPRRHHPPEGESHDGA